MTEEFLPVGEIAARLRVHRQTVTDWIARGELPVTGAKSVVRFMKPMELAALPSARPQQQTFPAAGASTRRVGPQHEPLVVRLSQRPHLSTQGTPLPRSRRSRLAPILLYV
jgi:excisionase family DNA binding protein